MNERIRDLKDKIWTEEYWTNPNTDKLLPAQLNRFAELIVGECIEQVRGQYIPVLEDKEMMKDTHWDGYVQCGVDSVVAIREHFGVEE